VFAASATVLSPHQEPLRTASLLLISNTALYLTYVFMHLTLTNNRNTHTHARTSDIIALLTAIVLLYNCTRSGFCSSHVLTVHLSCSVIIAVSWAIDATHASDFTSVANSWRVGDDVDCYCDTLVSWRSVVRAFMDVRMVSQVHRTVLTAVAVAVIMIAMDVFQPATVGQK